jgi:hypothetical protein
MKIDLIDPTISPIEMDGAQYMLYLDWLPPEERAYDSYEPALFIALWRDGGWWVLNDDTYIGDGDYMVKGCTLKPVVFSPLSEAGYQKLIGWYPLFGASTPTKEV